MLRVRTLPLLCLNENVLLLSIDNQLISLGLRLTLLLPAFCLFILIGSWAYEGTDPNWWESSIEPSVGQSFSSTLLLLGTVVGIGWLLALGIHRYRIALSYAAFVHEVEASVKRHQSIEALHGYDGMAHRIHKQLRMHSLSFTTVPAELHRTWRRADHWTPDFAW